MPAKHDDLHGNVPDDAAVALLLIDVINDLEFDGGEALLAQALPMATRIAALKRQATQAGIPAVYVNDNFGRWQSNFAKLLDRGLEDGVRGQPLAEQLRPEGAGAVSTLAVQLTWFGRLDWSLHRPGGYAFSPSGPQSRLGRAVCPLSLSHRRISSCPLGR